MVPYFMVFKLYRETFGEIEDADFQAICFDLSDFGCIVYTSEQKLSFSCLAVYYAVKTSSYTTLKWKEAAALKHPPDFSGRLQKKWHSGY